ncbi:TIGR01457 family HAD-type hydrolase [Aciduricibacillus chroicocephali]|uniref:Acid sugar phosphatase n=1 Tax=Aciduricibacillus chroicocephali TaxID=3054939 RepID=A0ABY9KT27_9BACI|nr:TIGR01457 family HAD-type hydrolase [Bacillaceae bacterium 44XB]
MKHYEGYLIDLDGTMYRGNEKIDAAPRFIRTLQEKDIPYLFLTNNASLTQKQITEKLNGFDIPARAEDVFSTAIATATFLGRKKKGARCFVIGEEGLHNAFQKEGLEIVQNNADYVVIGLDRHLTYDKLAAACLEIRAGAKFISTNSDLAIPREDGLYPGNGAITAAVSASTGVEPVFVGKPESIIMNEALRIIGTDKSRTIMVGDNYKTDIQAGIRAGLDTLMVFTGISKREDIGNLPDMPTYHVDTLDDWIKKM